MCVTHRMFFQAKIPNMEKFVLLGVVMTVLGSATAGPVLGGTKCTWGPSYWCANIPQVLSSTFINNNYGLHLHKTSIKYPDYWM